MIAHGVWTRELEGLEKASEQKVEMPPATRRRVLLRTASNKESRRQICLVGRERKREGFGDDT
jgi:hypothetical protein